MQQNVNVSAEGASEMSLNCSPYHYGIIFLFFAV
jgi:hypothetical protein